MVAEQALMFSRLAQSVQRVLVNGTAGIVSWLPGVEIDMLGDPARLKRLDLTILNQ